MNKRLLCLFLFLFGLFALGAPITRAADASDHDLVIYGGTSAGIIAGIQALKLGKSVVVIEPSDREGGLTTGGLGQTDIGNKMVIITLNRKRGRGRSRRTTATAVKLAPARASRRCGRSNRAQHSQFTAIGLLKSGWNLFYESVSNARTA